MQNDGAIVIGRFYEAPDGRIDKTCGWNDKRTCVLAYFDDDAGPFPIAEVDFRSDWTRQPDLRDFPNARDPLLPREFELFCGVRQRSGLVRLLGTAEDTSTAVAAMVECGIALTEAEKTVIENLRLSHGTTGSGI